MLRVGGTPPVAEEHQLPALLQTLLQYPQCLQEWLTQDLSSGFECLAMLVHLGAKQRECIECESRARRLTIPQRVVSLPAGMLPFPRDASKPRFVWTTARTLTQIPWIHYTQAQTVLECVRKRGAGAPHAERAR